MIDELPKLSAAELNTLHERIREARLKVVPGESLQQMFERIAGLAEDLPEDAAAQHDHYLYGTPKR